MKHRLVGIGYDSFSPILLERWIEAGELPNFAKLFERGTYARQRNFDLNRTENSWLTLLQGCSPQTSDEWGTQDYIEDEYRVVENPTYAFRKFPPFYALGNLRVAIFDLPMVRLVPELDGVQLLGWGTESNQIVRQSLPAGALDEIIRRHGNHPLHEMASELADGSAELSYRIPSIYDVARLKRLKDQLVAAIHERTAIIRELILADDWDLLLCAYAEIHTAGHLFWHASQVHALREPMRAAFDTDIFLEVARELDRSLGELLPLVPDDAELLLFSPHGMRANSLDLNAMLFLPELLYRWSSGKACFEGFGESGALPAPRLDYSRHWREETWDLTTPHGAAVLESPWAQEARGDPLDWEPGNWFRPLWHTMRAFSLPGYSEGQIRLNVAGRDGPDGIDPADFSATCDELRALLAEVIDARSGERLIEDVVVVRTQPHENPQHAPADLIVRWRDDLCGDAVEHPTLGRIGPVPYFRTGGHAIKGFMLGVGQTFAPGVRLADVRTEDVTATMLHRLGQPVPAHVTGSPIDAVALKPA